MSHTPIHDELFEETYSPRHFAGPVVEPELPWRVRAAVAALVVGLILLATIAEVAFR